MTLKGNPTTRFLFSVLAAAILPAVANASVVWRGDFSTGDLSQWKTQMVSPDRLQVIQADENPSSSPYVLRVLVKQGDNPIQASGNRNEVLNPTYTQEGEEAYYRWQVKFDPSFPSADAWQLFTQWHQKADYGGSPPIQFYVKGEEIILTLTKTENQVWGTPLVRGKWLDFVMHVKFSDDPKVGFIELWYNGEYVMEKTFGVTMAEDYLKLGLYRDASIHEDGVVFHTGMVRGQTYADVAGSQPPSSAEARSASATGSQHALASTSGGGCSSSGGPLSFAGIILTLAGLFGARRRRTAASPRRVQF